LKIGEQIHVLRHGQVLVQAEFLGHVADASLNLDALHHAVHLKDGDGPGRGNQQAGGCSDQRGFAGAVGTHKAGSPVLLQFMTTVPLPTGRR
jgi:hypothetical protein